VRCRTDGDDTVPYKQALIRSPTGADMIVNALTGEPRPPTLPQQEAVFTAEGAPPPGHTSGTRVPCEDEPARAPGEVEPLAQAGTAAPLAGRGA
jgi:hypothetical protein